ncbi:hypothetical protein ACIP80_18445 [Streptomyces sp. NPDC088555]|uniref:hypothetical protein n=1 Tax=Streptomyces sp. NPDC088555 TaxID=3365866 RepID=UPI00380194A6
MGRWTGSGDLDDLREYAVEHLGDQDVLAAEKWRVPMQAPGPHPSRARPGTGTGGLSAFFVVCRDAQAGRES